MGPSRVYRHYSTVGEGEGTTVRVSGRGRGGEGSKGGRGFVLSV